MLLSISVYILALPVVLGSGNLDSNSYVHLNEFWTLKLCSYMKVCDKLNNFDPLDRP